MIDCDRHMRGPITCQVFSKSARPSPNIQVLHCMQLDLFRFLEDVSTLMQKASSVLTN